MIRLAWSRSAPLLKAIIVKRVDIYVYLMLEFQTRDEPFMAVRVLDYQGDLYRQIVRALDLKRGDLLPLVVPVVLYRGQRTWKSETEVFDLIEPAPPEVESYLPHLRFLLIDIHALPPVELEAMPNPVACIFRMERIPTLGTAAIHDLDQLLSDPQHAELRRTIALWLTQTLLPLRLPGVNVPIVEKLEEVSPMIEEHAIDWTAQWKQQGEATLLLRQFRSKFGPPDSAVEERIESADAEQLLEWGERVLTANTLDEVFDGNHR